MDAEPDGCYSFADGLRTLTTALSSKLKQPVLFGVGAQSIQTAADGMPGRWLVRCSDESAHTADIVILACPAYKQAAMVADLDVELADSLLTIPYAGIVNIALGYRRIHAPSLVDSHSILVPQRFF